MTPTFDTNYVEHEFMTPSEIQKFCPGGNITQIECQTIDGIPSESSGEILTCNRMTGLTCSNQANDPIPCSDYQVRYYCLCSGNCILFSCSVVLVYNR